MLKSNDLGLIQKQTDLIEINLHNAITFYTDANLEASDDRLVESCAKFIEKHYPQIAIHEIEDAFSMYAAGKLGIEFKNYFGAFKIKHLGLIMRSYIEFRKKAIAKYDQNETLLLGRNPDAEKEEKNAKTEKQIIEAYNSILSHYKENGDTDYLESKIKAFWGEILVNNSIINFDHEEKRAILKEARKKIEKNINVQIVDESKRLMRFQDLRNIVSDLKNGVRNEKFESKIKSEYSRILILKSIINNV